MLSTLDTHEVVKELKAAGFTDEQAEAVTRVVRKTQDIDFSDLATKTDLNELKVATKADLNELKVATKADLTALRAELKTDIAELKSDLVKWVVGFGFAQIAAIVALIKLVPGAH